MRLLQSPSAAEYMFCRSGLFPTTSHCQSQLKSVSLKSQDNSFQYDDENDVNRNQFQQKNKSTIFRERHPDNPVNRDLFKIDREAYWKQRAEVEINARKKRKEFANNKIDIYVVRKS